MVDGAVAVTRLCSGGVGSLVKFVRLHFIESCERLASLRAISQKYDVQQLQSKTDFAARVIAEAYNRKIRGDKEAILIMVSCVLRDHFVDEPAILLLCCIVLSRIEEKQAARLLYGICPQELQGFAPEVGEILTCMSPVAQDGFGPVCAGCVQLPKSCAVQWVDTLPGLLKAREVLSAVSAVGIDCEFAGYGDSSRVTLLQIATLAGCFLFDVDALLQTAHDQILEFLASILESEVLKVVFHFAHDLKLLQAMMSKQNFEPKLCSIVDLRQQWPWKGEALGLQAIVHEVMPQNPLCKAEQCSAWFRRPLRQRQIHYAAMDAWILLICAEHLQHMLGLSTLRDIMQIGRQVPESSTHAIAEETVSNAEHYIVKLHAKLEAQLHATVLLKVEADGPHFIAVAELSDGTRIADSRCHGRAPKTQVGAKICCLRKALGKNVRRARGESPTPESSPSQQTLSFLHNCAAMHMMKIVNVSVLHRVCTERDTAWSFFNDCGERVLMLQVKKDAFVGMARGIKRHEYRKDKPNSQYYQQRLEGQHYDLVEFYQGGLCQKVPMLCFQYHGFVKSFEHANQTLMPSSQCNTLEELQTPFYVLKLGEERYRDRVDKFELKKTHLNCSKFDLCKSVDD